jgi:hypothetical protein
MPADRGLKTVIFDLKEFSERNGHQIQDDVEVTTGDGRQVVGYDYIHGDNIVQIRTVEEREPVTVIYTYSLPEVLAIERIRRSMDGQQPIQPDLVQQELPLAKQEIVSQIEDLEPHGIMQLQNTLVQSLSAPETQYSPDTRPSGIPIEFRIIRNMFPERDSFDISKYNRATQSVVSVGIRGKNMLENAFNLFIPDESGSSMTPPDADNDDGSNARGFQ